MCGRYSLTTPSEAMRRIFGFVEQPNLQARYNVAPTQDVPVLRLGEDGKRHFSLLRWGLIPFWAKEASIGSRMINARSETLAEKPAFRQALAKRRCLILADGFYEWRKLPDGSKQPYRVTLPNPKWPDGEPFAFAGLWEKWRDPSDNQFIESCTIATTEARGAIAAIHHRMPVILPAHAYDHWLERPENPSAEPAFLASKAIENLEAHPVSTKVNKVSNDDPSVIEPVDHAGEGKPANKDNGTLSLFD